MHSVHLALQTCKILCENFYVPYNFLGSFIHSRYRDRLMLHRKVIFPALNVGHVNICSSCYSFTMIDSIQLSWFYPVSQAQLFEIMHETCSFCVVCMLSFSHSLLAYKCEVHI